MSCEHPNGSSSCEELVGANHRQQERGDPAVAYADKAMRLRRQTLEKTRRKRSRHSPLIMGRPMTI